ncbi:MAG: twin-arginine translocase TatA/TatE family subunit [Kiritimatiellales bacterium]
MNTLALIPGMQGAPEILLIIFVILLLFGSKKLPELARSLGKSLNEFKRGQTESTPGKKIEKPAEDEPEEKKKQDEKKES